MFNSVDFIKGIKALSEFVSIDKKYAEKHQQTVIDCLNDHDDSLKRKVRMYSLDVNTIFIGRCYVQNPTSFFLDYN